LVQPVRFEADERGSEVRLLAPRRATRWAPRELTVDAGDELNGLGLTLSTLRATLLLENARRHW
jgi:hypothetical protein